MKNLITAAIVFALLSSMAVGFQFINLAHANFFPDPGPDLPRIYIRNDGSVDPATVPIERAGSLYTLTDNIVLHTVEIQCDNIVFDGRGYMIQGNASRIKGYDDGNNGIIVVGQNNVTIINTNFEQGDTGIRISESSHINITGNMFTNGLLKGTLVEDCSFVQIEHNSFIDLHTDIGTPAVMLDGSKIVFRNNTVSGSSYGIKIIGSSNSISENTLQCILPVQMDDCYSNIVSLNKISGPATASGREPFTGGEGIALFKNCSGNTFFGNNITGFVGQAIRTVFGCSNNTFYGNYFENNGFAVTLQDGAVNNTFYGNIFAADSCKIHIDDGVEGTCWDNGTIGNYWGDYNGTDAIGDGIGDSPHIVIAYKWDTDVGGDVSYVSGQDNYPLMNPVDISTIPEFPSWIFLVVGFAVVAVLSVIYKHQLLRCRNNEI